MGKSLHTAAAAAYSCVIHSINRSYNNFNAHYEKQFLSLTVVDNFASLLYPGHSVCA